MPPPEAPSSKTRRRNAALRSIWRIPGAKDGRRVDHRQLVEPLRVADAGHLVRGLGDLGRTDHVARVGPVVRRHGPQHRVRLVIDADAGTGQEMVGKRPGEEIDPVVEVGEQRSVQVIVRQVGRHAVDEGRVEVRRRISFDDNGHRTEQGRAVAVLRRHRGTGGVGDRARSQQNQAVDAMRVELILQAFEARLAHAGEVRHRRDRQPADRRSHCPVVDAFYLPPTSLSFVKMQR